VLDPFVGSGSTAVAAFQNERIYIGFDISKEYCQYARKRILRPVQLRKQKDACTPRDQASHIARALPLDMPTPISNVKHQLRLWGAK
ncbi:MAG: DNA methyltransferase, partial [Planctomycetota bacterium]